VPPSAISQSLTTNEDTSLSIALSGSAGSGGELGFDVTSPVAYGVLEGTTPDLVYTPDQDYFGQDSFRFKVNDGVSDSGQAAVTIAVQPVNDPPTFDLTDDPDQTVLADAGAQSVLSFAANMAAGPPNGSESDQSLAFLVSNDNNALFSAQPSIDSNGTLTYAPDPNADGQATVSVSLMDDGGTANGGSDSSSEKSFTITVQGVAGP